MDASNRVGWPPSQAIEEYLKLPTKSQADIDLLFTFIRQAMDALIRDQPLSMAIDSAHLIFLYPIVEKFLNAMRCHVHLERQSIDRLRINVSQFRNRAAQLDELKLRAEFFGRRTLFRSILRRLLIPFSFLTHSPDPDKPTDIATIHDRYLTIRREITQTAQTIYTDIMTLYASFVSAKDSAMGHLDFYDFYIPDLCKKQNAMDLVEQAMGIIRDDEAITSGAKKRILSHLQDALDELKKPRPDWTRCFGRIKEAVIVLGALGSFVGGTCALNQATAKLEEATQVIATSSINIHYVNQVNNQITAAPPNVYLLPQSSPKDPAAQTYIAETDVPSESGVPGSDQQSAPSDSNGVADAPTCTPEQ